jgi:hypothetical protein
VLDAGYNTDAPKPITLRTFSGPATRAGALQAMP